MVEPKLIAVIVHQAVRVLDEGADVLELQVNYDVAVGKLVRQTVLVHSMRLPATATAAEIQEAIANYGEAEVWPRYVEAPSSPANDAARTLAGRDLDVKALKATRQ